LRGRERVKVKKIKVGDRLVGEGEPTFVVAEIGVNHNGSVGMAKRLIDAAKEAGADAVKFQAYKTDRIVTKYAEKARYQRETDPGKSQYEMLKKLELKDDDFRQLYGYAKRRNITFLSSAFDDESVDLLDSLGVVAFKVPSGEATNLPLLRHIAAKRKPVILSTGMSTLDEIGEALGVLRKKGVESIILLHCVTSYPTKVEEANLKVMTLLKRKFGFPVGFSDHTEGVFVPVSAVALGAVLIEKHFTLSKDLPGPDHRASLEPSEFKQMVMGIRVVEKALGDGVKRVTADEEEIKEAARKSIVARVRIPRGTLIREDMLDFKRPGTGLRPKDLSKVVGRRTKTAIEADELINLEKLW
jgi:N-acetylneuraminate synthase/N,N'-diacetyllegionaminate synthase